MKRSDYFFLIFIALLLCIFFAASRVLAQASYNTVSPDGVTLSTSNGDGVVFTWTTNDESQAWLSIVSWDESFLYSEQIFDYTCVDGECSYFYDAELVNMDYEWNICDGSGGNCALQKMFTVVNAPPVNTFPIDAIVAVCAFTILLWWIPKSEVRLLPALCAFIFQPYWVEAAFVAFVTSLVLGTFLFLVDLADGLSEEKR